MGYRLAEKLVDIPFKLLVIEALRRERYFRPRPSEQPGISQMIVPAVIVAAVFVYGIVRIGFYTLGKKGDRAGVLTGVSLMVVVAMFGLWVVHFLAFRSD